MMATLPFCPDTVQKCDPAAGGVRGVRYRRIKVSLPGMIRIGQPLVHMMPGGITQAPIGLRNGNTCTLVGPLSDGAPRTLRFLAEEAGVCYRPTFAATQATDDGTARAP